MTDSGKPSAITITQVLFVIVIILIVLPEVMPGSSGPVTDYNLLCGANLKQFGIGFIQYSQDYDGDWPVGETEKGGGWAGQVYPYVKSTAAYKCPADLTTTTQPNTFVCSYAYNSNLVRTGKPVLSGMFTNPRRTVVLSEINGNASHLMNFPEQPYDAASGIVSAAGDGVGLYDDMNTGTKGLPKNGALYVTGSALGLMNESNSNIFGHFKAVEGVHSGGSNFLLADGHVKWLQPEEVSVGVNGISGCTQGVRAASAAQIPVSGGINAAATNDPTNTFTATFSYE